MITKAQIEQLKRDNPQQLYALLSSQVDHREVLIVLENLGHLPPDFDLACMLPLTQHTTKEIRLWAVKNLGKIANPEHLAVLRQVAENPQEDSMVCREAVSSIGRMRLHEGQSLLIKFLSHEDPKIVVQAIRGLLVFKDDSQIREALLELKNHPNEMIQSIIRREFSTNGKGGGGVSVHPHPQSPDFMKNVVVQGDVRTALNHVPDESIHLTFTSPPYYNARDYSIYVSYQAYLDFLNDVFAEVHRVTKAGRFLIVNTSPVIVPRISRAHASTRYPIPFDLHARLVQQGWEFIDDIIWLKPESSVKNRNAGFLQHRKPLAYKPNATTEYLMVYRKQTEKLLDWNMNQYDSETIEKSRVQGEYETSNVWRIDPVFDRVHSAVFPLELCNRVIRFYSYRGDLVFDPFGGSGTLGKSARALERYFFLIEKEEKYIERMKESLSNTYLFENTPTKFLTLSQFELERQKSTW